MRLKKKVREYIVSQKMYMSMGMLTAVISTNKIMQYDVSKGHLEKLNSLIASDLIYKGVSEARRAQLVSRLQSKKLRDKLAEQARRNARKGGGLRQQLREKSRGDHE